MATKGQSTAKKNIAAKKSTSTAKKATKRKISPSVLYKERNPEKHVVTGKYKFFYVLFACTTIFFAAIAAELYVFSSEILNKYEEVDACVRTHSKCKVTYNDGDISAEGEE